MCLVRWVGCVSLVVSPVHLLPRFKRIYLIDLSKSPRRIGSKFLSGFVFLQKIFFPRQSLKIFTFRFKLSDSIFFLLGHSPIVKLI